MKERLEDGLPHYPYVPESVARLRKTDTPVFLTEGEKKAMEFAVLVAFWPEVQHRATDRCQRRFHTVCLRR